MFVEVGHEHPVRLDQPVDLGQGGCVQHLEAENLYPAGGRTSAAADEHQEEENADGESAPAPVVGRRKAGAGDDRDHVERDFTI